MSNLEKDYDSVLAEIQDKLEQATKLLEETKSLSKDHNIGLDKSKVDNLLDILYDLPVDHSWAESYDTRGSWSTSLGYYC